MNWCALVVWVVGAAAAADPATPSASDRDGTYIIRLTNGQAVYGFIRDEDKAQGVLVVEGDEPLTSGFRRTRRIRMNTVQDRAREFRAQREERIDRTLEEAGYVRVGELTENWSWVSKREYELAQRARERAAALERASSEIDQAADPNALAPTAAPPDAGVTGETDANAAFSEAEAGRGWGRYAAAGVIGVVGLAVAGFVLRRMVF